jgi:hypothetical protein
VRDRVKELAGRGYIDPQDGTLDCVLLFIPNEQVYGFVHEQDPQLLDDALARKVVLCSPSTLFAVLAVIREAVDRVALERTSDRDPRPARRVRDQWERFTEAMDKVGRGLETTQRAYDALTTTRRSQLERQLDRVAELRDQRDTAPEGDTASAGRSSDDRDAADGRDLRVPTPRWFRCGGPPRRAADAQPPRRWAVGTTTMLVVIPILAAKANLREEVWSRLEVEGCDASPGRGTGSATSSAPRRLRSGSGPRRCGSARPR